MATFVQVDITPGSFVQLFKKFGRKPDLVPTRYISTSQDAGKLEFIIKEKDSEIKEKGSELSVTLNDDGTWTATAGVSVSI